MKPTILIAATSRWIPTARLARSLANAGFNVDAVCLPEHPMKKVSTVRRIFAYSGMSPNLSLTTAMRASNPDLIVPADDTAVRHILSLYRESQHHPRSAGSLCDLIERSLGSSDSFSILQSRTALIDVAREEGIRSPMTEVIYDVSHLEAWIGRAGFPTLLKANGTSSGEGVRIARNWKQAKQAFRALQAPPLLIRAAKRTLINHDTQLVWPALLRRRSTVNAQAFVPGNDATSLVVCWRGKVLAGLHFEVLEKQYINGPASVMRLIDNTEMARAAEKICRRLNLSGFHGFDFIVEEGTGHAHLIEMNPRTTQVGHLTLGCGRDLPAELFAAVTQTTVRESPCITDKATIALFPQEWNRDPHSPFLESAYHDVPWEEPELIRACVRKPADLGLYFQRGKSRTLAAARLPDA